MKKIYVLCLLVGLFFIPTALYSGETAFTYSKETTQVSVFSITSDWAITFFQKFISPIDNRRCIFSPTCSVYARQTVKKYGVIKAYPLITARLIRCNGSAYHSRQYDMAEEGKGGPCYDPVQ